MDGRDCLEISTQAGFKPGKFLLPPPPGVVVTAGEEPGLHNKYCAADGVGSEVDCKTARTNSGPEPLGSLIPCGWGVGLHIIRQLNSVLTEHERHVPNQLYWWVLGRWTYNAPPVPRYLFET